jgi:hypothetical protein
MMDVIAITFSNVSNFTFLSHKRHGVYFKCRSSLDK